MSDNASATIVAVAAIAAVTVILVTKIIAGRRK